MLRLLVMLTGKQPNQLERDQMEFYLLGLIVISRGPGCYRGGERAEDPLPPVGAGPFGAEAAFFVSVA
jgi:hypothetical protein